MRDIIPVLVRRVVAGRVKAQYRAGSSLQRGFTMVEAIVVIIITGIIGAAVAIFIRMPVQGYVDSVARAQLTDVADTTLRRVARDLRLALPNSVRVSPTDSRYMELLLTKTGGRYLAADDYPTSGNILDFYDASKVKFDLVGTPPSSPQNIAAPDYIVVYNHQPGEVPADAYNCSGPCNRAQVASISSGTVTLTSNPFAAQPVKMMSPTHRFQVVTGPVTYFCDGTSTGGSGNLIRYWGYTIQSSQPITAAALATGASADHAILATKVESCTFTQSTLIGIQSDLIGLTISLLDSNSNAGRVVLSHQVHVDNTP